MEIRGKYNQKLTIEKVEELRKRYGEGETQQVLAETFGISQVTVSHIVNFRIWKTSVLKNHDESISKQEIRLNECDAIIESNSRQIRDLKSKNTELEKITTKLKKEIVELNEWKELAIKAIESQQMKIERLEAQING